MFLISMEQTGEVICRDESIEIVDKDDEVFSILQPPFQDTRINNRTKVQILNERGKFLHRL
jgi:hypothetical protein